jgi:hypothetical protein
MSTCAHCGIVRVHITLFFQCNKKGLNINFLTDFRFFAILKSEMIDRLIEFLYNLLINFHVTQ